MLGTVSQVKLLHVVFDNLNRRALLTQSLFSQIVYSKVPIIRKPESKKVAWGPGVSKIRKWGPGVMLLFLQRKMMKNDLVCAFWPL